MVGGCLQLQDFREQMSCDEATPKEARLSISDKAICQRLQKTERKKKTQFKLKTIALCMLIHGIFFLE